MAKASGKAENGGPGNGEVTRLRRTFPDADGLDQARAAMNEAIKRLGRLENIMHEMIRAGLAPTVGGSEGLIATGPPAGHAAARTLAARIAVLGNWSQAAGSPAQASGPATEADTAEPTPVPGQISRRMLDELAAVLGKAHAHPRAGRELRPVDGARKDTAAPSYLHLDRHLRLPLDSGSNYLEIERWQDGCWHRTGLRAVKDRMGGIKVDIARLERLAGPFSPELRRILAPDPRPQQGRSTSPDDRYAPGPQRRDQAGMGRITTVMHDGGEVTEETMVQPTIHVAHEDYGSSGRYVVTLPGIEGEAELTWRAGGPGIIVADHTYAPDAMRGSGAAAALVRRLVADARARGVLIVPACSYVRAQFDRHPDWSDLRADA
ncbi:GNAT family N-acetyltransferase [Paracoccus denitrificans]|uniref:GNAT family N-acetyltransferase n=1 Tax=Paracoccus denitrificans TaxID=266 RepID=UPI003989A732